MILDQGSKQIEAAEKQRKKNNRRWWDIFWKALINKRHSEIKKISDSIDYNQLDYKTKPGTSINFSVYKNPSDCYFSIKNTNTKLSDVKKMHEKIEKELSKAKKKVKSQMIMKMCYVILKCFMEDENVLSIGLMIMENLYLELILRQPKQKYVLRI